MPWRSDLINPSLCWVLYTTASGTGGKSRQQQQRADTNSMLEDDDDEPEPDFPEVRILVKDTPPPIFFNILIFFSNSRAWTSLLMIWRT